MNLSLFTVGVLAGIPIGVTCASFLAYCAQLSFDAGLMVLGVFAL